MPSVAWMPSVRNASSMAATIAAGAVDRPGFADALEAFGVVAQHRRADLDERRLDRRHTPSRQRVVQEIGGDERAVGLVDRLLHQGVAHAVDQAALQLSIDQQWIDGLAAVVGDRVTQHRHSGGVRIDRQHDGVHGAGERAAALEGRLRRERTTRVEQVGQRDVSAWHAPHLDPGWAKTEVVRAHFEHGLGSFEE